MLAVYEARDDRQRALGEYAESLTSFQRSASLHRRLGDRGREAMAWHGAGETYRAMERTGEAADFHRRAAAVHRELGDRWHEALALEALALDGEEGGAGDDPAEATAPSHRHRTEALRLLDGYDDLRAAELRARVRERREPLER